MHTLAESGPARRTGMMAVFVVVLTTFLATFVGCASTPGAPTASLKSASDTIDRAERSDARQHAGAELDEAKDKLMQAERAVESENMQRAEQLAEQARIVAELAMARTDAAKALEVNRQLRQDAEALDEEMQRMGDQQ